VRATEKASRLIGGGSEWRGPKPAPFHREVLLVVRSIFTAAADAGNPTGGSHLAAHEFPGAKKPRLDFSDTAGPDPGQPANSLPTKPFPRADEAGLKRRCAMITLDQTTRFGRVGIHHQPGLRPVLREILGRPGPSPAPVDLIPA